MYKLEILKLATEAFKNSHQTSKDYMDFSIAIVSCFRQGTGLIWADAEKIFNECITVDDHPVENYCGVQYVPNVKSEPDSLHARIIQFCEHKYIDSVDKLAKVIAPMVDQMSLHCRHITFNDRKPFRDIKHKFLELMYKYGVASDVIKRISKSPLGQSRTDTLIELTIGGIIFHVPDRNQNFVDITTLDLHPEIFFRNETVPVTAIDYTFKRHMELLTNLESVIKYITKEA